MFTPMSFSLIICISDSIKFDLSSWFHGVKKLWGVRFGVFGWVGVIIEIFNIRGKADPGLDIGHEGWHALWGRGFTREAWQVGVAGSVRAAMASVWVST